MARAYDSPLREAQKEETRRRILDAVVAVITEDGIHAFTVPNVAKKAGVSQRTIYRHFDTREALLEGLSQELESTMSQRVGHDPDFNAANIRATWSHFTEQPVQTRAYVLASLALQYHPAVRQRRSERFVQRFLERYPNLDPDEVRPLVLLLRTLVGSRGWFLLDAQGAADVDAIVHVFDLVVADLASRNAHVREE